MIKIKDKMDEEEASFWTRLASLIRKSRKNFSEIYAQYKVMADWFEQRKHYDIGFTMRWLVDQQKVPHHSDFSHFYSFFPKTGRGGRINLPDFILRLITRNRKPKHQRSLSALFYSLSKALVTIRKQMMCASGFMFLFDGD